MTRHPPHPLDAEERALAALLPRPHGRGEPGADMDARILAAAQDALHPQPAGRHPRRSWIGPTALAASLVLAVGLAWQLRPPPSLPAPAPAPAVTAAASANAEAAEMRAFEPPPSSPPPMARTLPRTAPPADTGVPAVSKQAARAADNAPAPPPAPPAPGAPEVVGDAAPVATPQIAEPARVPTKAASEATREGTAASGASVAENRDEAQRGADTATLGTTGAGQPEEDVPPATADSPEVREAWLRRIGELLAQGNPEEAKASLSEFRRRYPHAPLPPELRKLEP